jgi:hypothetical protein
LNEYYEVREKFLKVLKKGHEAAFRKLDDALQEAKGQPSLEYEDTGVQYLKKE